MKHFLNPDVVKFSEVTAIYEQKLLENTFEKSYIMKKNLKRKINDAFPEINFTSLDNNHLLCFPNTLSTKTLVKMLYGVRMELLAFNTRNENENTLLNAAGILRKEINDLNDTLPWPPSPDDLSVDKFKTPQLLETFLHTLLNGKFTDEILHLICRLGHGASYTLIEELDTENTYQQISSCRMEFKRKYSRWLLLTILTDERKPFQVQTRSKCFFLFA